MAAPLSQINAILREVLRNDDLEVEPPTRFDELAGWDSMDLVSVVVEVECRFNVQFALPEIDRLATVADLLDMVEAKRALAAA